MEAILRRTGQNNPEDVISAGGIVIDKAAHLATVDGKPMELSFKEFELDIFSGESGNRTFQRKDPEFCMEL